MKSHQVSMLITVALLGILVALFLFPSAWLFMVGSALVAILIGVMVVGVLRAPDGKEAKDRESDADWYDK